MPQPISASEAHLNSDIRLTMRALLATQKRTRLMYPERPETEAYAEGFQDAFMVLADALNINLGIATDGTSLHRIRSKP